MFFFFKFFSLGPKLFDEHTPLTRTVQGKVACCYQFNQRTLYFNELFSEKRVPQTKRGMQQKATERFSVENVTIK